LSLLEIDDGVAAQQVCQVDIQPVWYLVFEILESSLAVGILQTHCSV
jgi:hypothetical protein